MLTSIYFWQLLGERRTYDRDSLAWKDNWTNFVLIFSDLLNKVIRILIKDSIFSYFNNEYLFRFLNHYFKK